MNTPKTVAETLGWYGVIAILTAYAATNLGWLDTTSLLYQVLNITGAAGILIDAYRQKNYQPVVLNAIWMLIAFYAIIQSFL